MNREQIIELLKEHNIKPSLQRIAVMSYLDENRTHPSVDEVYNYVFKIIPTLSKTTVYNVLKLLNSKGVIQIITIDDKKVLFDANAKAHPHFICIICKKVFDMDLPEEKNMKQGFMFNGNLIQETHVYYKGVCRNCLEKNMLK